MMLRHLDEESAAVRVETAVSHTLASGIKTRDLGGNVTTTDMAEAIVAAIEKG